MKVAKTIILTLVLVLGFALNASADKSIKFPIQEAIKKAQEKAGKEWKIILISNTGVSQSVTAEGIESAEEALMSKDGKAGQWVVELIKDPPKSIKAENPEGKMVDANEYEFKVISVTKKAGASELPESTMTLPKPQTPIVITENHINAFDKALKLAQANTKEKYELLSATYHKGNWIFKFYGKEDVVAGIEISGDGTKTGEVYKPKKE